MDTTRTPSDELLDALPLPYLSLGPIGDHGIAPTDLCVTWANASARQRFGDDVVGRWLRRDEPLGSSSDDLADVIAGTPRDSTIERVAVRDGLCENHRIRIVPLSTGTALFIEDIDAEVRTRDALSASADALARVQRWGHVGVWDLDVDTGAVYWSTQVHELLGLEHPGLEEFRSVVHPEDVALIDHLQARVLSQPGPYRATHRIIRDGEIRTLDQHVQSVADDDGRPVRLIGTMVDVTEMHHLRDQVLQAERARTIGVVAAGVAHDFNNLLTVIEGHASLLLGRTEDDGGLRMGLEAIKRAASEASTTTRKLMGLGREESIECAPVELCGLFSDVAGWTRPAAPRVVVVEDVRDPGLVVADEAVLRQVLLDLVLNACDADATTVRLAAEEVELDRQAEAVVGGDLRAGRYARVDVVDDGRGMDASTRERALEPFFSTKTQQGGSGLGLATASTNVTRMNGHLAIATEPGRGTTVSIHLPLLDDGREASRSRRHPRATRIVVACADPEHAERAQRLAADAGHQVVVVSDLQALAFCLVSEPIDMAIVHVRLAGDDEWPDELRHIPTVWVDELATADARRDISARIAQVIDSR